MTQQDSAAVARSFFEAWNERDYDRGASLMSEQGELVEVATDERFRGRDGLRQEYDKWANAFPDGKVEIRNSFAAGDWAAVELTFHGTNTGALVGGEIEIPPTGRSLTFDFCTVVQVRDGRVLRARHYHDTGTIAQQLELTTAGAAAPA